MAKNNEYPQGATDNWIQFQNELLAACMKFVLTDRKNKFNSIHEHEEWCIEQILTSVDMGDFCDVNKYVESDVI